MDVNEALVRRVVDEVLRGQLGAYCAQFEKQRDPSGVLCIRTNTVKCEPFVQAGVAVKDVTTLGEAPRMGCGIMELTETTFPWTLTYDEYDLVLEGTLEIVVEGRTLTGNPGDILYVPKDTAIEFRCQKHTRYAYFVYPADWK